MNDFELIGTQKLQRIRWAVSLFFFCQGLVFASWASRIPTIKSALQISDAQLGTTLLLMPLGQILTMALSGRLVTKFSSKKIIPLASLGYAIILCFISYTYDILSLSICLFFFGILSNMGNIAVNTQGVAVEKLYNKSIMSSFHGAWSLAGFIGALIGLLTMQFHINAHIHFIIILGIILLNIILNTQYLTNDINTTKTDNKKLIKPDRIIIQLGIICFLVMATEGAMFDWSGVYFKDVVQVPEKWIPLGYTAFMINMAFGRFLGDSVISKLGKVNTLKLSGALMSIGLLLSVIFPYLLIATLCFMLVGLGVATVVPTVYSAAGKHPSIPPGQSLAMVSSISFFGFLIGPPLIGYISEWTSLRHSFALYSLFGLILLLLVNKI